MLPVASALVLAAAQGGAADAGRSRLPAAPVRSHDGALVVGAAAATADYRLPVLTFAGEVRADLMRVTGLRFGSRTRPVSIVLGPGGGGRGVTLSRGRDPAGAVREQVGVPDPAEVDLDEFRHALVRAFVRVWLLEAGDAAAASAREPPEWLLRGLARRQVRETRMHDFERTYRLWSRGRLPVLAEMLQADSTAARDPAVAAVLVAHIRGMGAPGERFRDWLSPLATGGVWRAESVLSSLAPPGDAWACEREWDRWMLAGGRTILVAGVTPPGAVRRFCNQLRLFPSDVAAPVTDGWRGLEPADLITAADQPWARLLASRKEHQIQIAAIGRDETLLRIAADYARFFRCVAMRGDAEEAARLLQIAHSGLLDAAQQAAAGKTMGAPPEHGEGR